MRHFEKFSSMELFESQSKKVIFASLHFSNSYGLNLCGKSL